MLSNGLFPEEGSDDRGGVEEPLATIARQVGYSTEFAFGVAFRREYGISPGRFRDGQDQSENHAPRSVPLEP